MTLYAPSSIPTVPPATPLTKTFAVMVWVEVDRVRQDQKFYTVTITGIQGAQPSALSYTVDGKAASMQDVNALLAWARTSGGSRELVAEEVAA